ncbi:MAG: ComF family protein [Flavobacteriaceae bacterium]
MPITGYDFVSENPIDRTFFGRIDIEKAGAFLFFHEQGLVKTLIHNLKYKGHTKIGELLGEWYGHILKNDAGLSAIDLVVPVPLHPKKLRKRGYNQVSKFAHCLAQHLSVPVREDILVKTANTKTQTKKGRVGRWLHSHDLYLVKEGVDLLGQSILLVDDVITTGATMEACSLALKKAGNPKIYLAAMAVVPLD